MPKSLSILLILTSMMVMSNVQSQAGELSTKAPQETILDDPETSLFKAAILAAGLGDLFLGTGPFTVFVPSNQAFEKFGQSKMQELLKKENQDQLTSMLIYHIVPGKYLAQNLTTKNIRTINGKNLHVVVENGEIRVNNAKVIKTDRIGPNGVAHMIDTVLVP